MKRSLTVLETPLSVTDATATPPAAAGTPAVFPSRADAAIGGARGPEPSAPEARLRLGVSSCLLGAEVRYNGGHSRDEFLARTLDPWVEWLPLCPEVEIGLGTPRETIRLTGSIDAPRLQAPRSGRDLTDAMQSWARQRVEEIAAARLHGYVLKKGSPSCGLYRVRVYDQRGMAQSQGRGLFAAILAERLPLLPLEEEGRLQDPALRENFLERAFTMRRFERLLDHEPTIDGLLRFHAEHKLVLMAHSPAAATALGRLLARPRERSWTALVREYATGMAAALRVLATRGRHANVLEHLAGFLGQGIDRDDRAEIVESIRQYRMRWVPLPVPLALVRHHLRRTGAAPWALRQVYLAPYPEALALRNAL
jgi:uncharacterized protein YbbK (DUF523 family)/uncharacterized protein YbgA (DUF1722 family)